MGFALFLGVLGVDKSRVDVLLELDAGSASAIADIMGGLPLGCTSARPGRLVLSSELSLPPVSTLCEEFDCSPPAAAAACPAKEKALSLLSSMVQSSKAAATRT